MLRRRRPRGTALQLIALFIALASLIPLLFILVVSVQVGWETVIALVWRPRVAELLGNTLALIALTLPICILLGVTIAWLTERTDLPGRRLISALAVAPLAIPAFIHSYAWVSLVPSIHGLSGAVLVSVLAYFPFLYLPIAATLRRLDPALEDVATALGLAPWRVFMRVVLPQLRLPVAGGALLVGLHLLAEFGLYTFVRFDTFTTAIYDQFQSSFNGPAANMLAGVLMLCCLGLLALEASCRGSARYARLGSGSPRGSMPQSLGWGIRLAGLLLMGTVLALALGVPLLTLLHWLSAGTQQHWAWQAIVPALAQTLALASVAAVLTLAAAVPVSWLAIRAPCGLQRWLEKCHYVSSSLPGIVVALALVTVSIRYAPGLYQTLVTLLLAYVLMFLPRAMINLRAGIAQAPIELEDMARSLGRSPRQALLGITLRLAAPGAAAAAALVFLGVINELTATLLLAPNGTRTLASAFWAKSSEIDYAAAAPYALLMVLMSLPLTWLLHSHSRRAADR